MLSAPLEVRVVTFDQLTELPPEEELGLLPHAAAKAAVLAATRKVAIALLLRTFTSPTCRIAGVQDGRMVAVKGKWFMYTA
jgi:hypothetical protein